MPVTTTLTIGMIILRMRWHVTTMQDSNRQWLVGAAYTSRTQQTLNISIALIYTMFDQRRRCWADVF